ncbi:uncharacterized protein [Dysidea avara]|uniref:uncharacterized protein isoform X2 n=1 Tax=Dysidea avara TaxID=196820 RepID=UPI003326DAC6
MSILSLRIEATETQRNTVIRRTVQFDQNAMVRGCISVIHQRMPEVNLGDNEGDGLFQPTSGNNTGRWLAEDKSLRFYGFTNGDLVEYVKKVRLLQVKMMDGTLESISVDTSQNVGELVRIFSVHIGITTPEEYSFTFHQPSDQQKPMSTGKTRRKSLSHISTDKIAWLDHDKSLRAQGVKDTEVIVYKKKFFFFKSVDSAVEIHLQFHQLHRDVSNDNLWCTQQEAVKLAALRCQVEFGDYDKAKPYLTDPSSFLPLVYSKVKHISDLVIVEHHKLHGMSEVIAKLQYVQLCQSLPTYGVTFFLVRDKVKGRKKLVSHLLGIKKDSVLSADASTKNIMKTWPLTMIRRYVASLNSFTFDFGDYSDGFYSVSTAEGKEISYILDGYINMIVSCRHDHGLTRLCTNTQELVKQSIINDCQGLLADIKAPSPASNANSEMVPSTLSNSENCIGVKMPEMLANEKLDEDEVEEDEVGKLDEDEVDKLDEDEVGKLDEDEVGKLDEAESDKLDEDEVGKLDEDEVDKLDEDEVDKLDEDEVGKLDEAESDKLDEDEVGKLDEAESDKLDEDEVGKLDEDEVGKLDEAEGDKLDEDEVDKLDEDEVGKLDEDEGDKLDEDEGDKLDEDEVGKLEEDEVGSESQELNCLEKRQSLLTSNKETSSLDDGDTESSKPREVPALLHQYVLTLKNQIEQLEATYNGQLADVNITISKLHEDAEFMEKIHNVKLENIAQATERNIQKVMSDGQQHFEQLQESNSFILDQLSHVQQQLLDVQKNNEDLKANNLHIQRQLTFTQNQLTLTQQQLLGLRSMMTSSRLWVVSGDQFTVGKEIGRGAWATVHEATFRGATVAAKCLHDVITSPKTRELFQREMAIALVCQHQSIVTFLGATVEGPPVILMELMDINLRKGYELGRIVNYQIHGILHDVAKALHFLHTRPDPVIHRDVSSANVLLKVLYNGEWLAKLGDLGTAKIQKQVATAGPGSIAYGAPEAGDYKKHSPKMDVYSFGVVFIETLTKTHPFQMVDTLKAQVQQQYPQYDQLVTSCTKQQSSDRPTMYDVLVQLDEIAATAAECD